MPKVTQLVIGWASEVMSLTSQDWGQMRQHVWSYRGLTECAAFKDLQEHSKFHEGWGHVFLLTVVSPVLTTTSGTEKVHVVFVSLIWLG